MGLISSIDNTLLLPFQSKYIELYFLSLATSNMCTFNLPNLDT